MGFFFVLCLIILSCFSMASEKAEALEVMSARLLDLYIRDYTFKSFDKIVKTGALHRVLLPANFTGVSVDTARFRCGSLRRYGAQVKEFHLGVGVSVSPCVERIVLVRQNLGSNWSSIYYSNYDLSGYHLVSSILGLFAYNSESYQNFTAPIPIEVGISAGEKPIIIDFSNASRIANISGNGITPICASFESNGKVTLAQQVSPYICSVRRQGHFGLVMEEPQPVQLRKKDEAPWKVAVSSSIGAAIGAFLLGLLLVAMFVRVKKRTRMDELERRAYEEEALQVSMVGHVRAPTALGTRTLPSIEHEYLPPRR